MTTDTFLASAQYDDFKGTVAADNADHTSAYDWLKENGHIERHEILLGIKMFAGENHGKQEEPVRVRFYVASLGDDRSMSEMEEADDITTNLRTVETDMSLHDFFGLFKQFSVALSRDGMLDDAELSQAGSFNSGSQIDS